MQTRVTFPRTRPVVLDKENAQARKGIFMVDASKGFIKDGNKNRLRAQDIHKIVDIFNRNVELPRYSRMVPLAEIEAHGFNLNLPRYIDSSEPEDLQDIEGHLRGGIPVRDVDQLAPYWQVLPGLRAELFTEADRPGYCQSRVVASEVKAAILGHAEFTAFNQQITALFAGWTEANRVKLAGIQKGDRPKALIDELSESLLAAFRVAPLLDAYDVYQHLMDYWTEALQDDVHLLSVSGWKGAIQIREIFQAKNKEGKAIWLEDHDFKVGKRRFRSDLVSAKLVIARYFVADHTALSQLQADVDSLTSQLEELDEEHSSEDSLLADARTDKNKLTAKSLKDRLKAIKPDKDAADERKLLELLLDVMESEAAIGRKVKDAQKALDAKVASQYSKLTEAEIKVLVVDDKWLVRLAADVLSERDRVSQALTGRIRELTERYAEPLPQLADDVATLASRVDEHIRKMGFVWI